MIFSVIKKNKNSFQCEKKENAKMASGFPPHKQETQPGIQHVMDPTPQFSSPNYKPASNKLHVGVQLFIFFISHLFGSLFINEVKYQKNYMQIQTNTCLRLKPKSFSYLYNKYQFMKQSVGKSDAGDRRRLRDRSSSVLLLCSRRSERGFHVR